MVAEVADAVRPRYTTHYRTQTMHLDLDEPEQFEVPVQRHHRARRWVHVDGVHVSWSTYTEHDGEQGSSVLWALVGNIVREDGSMGAQVRVPGAYLDPPPETVTKVVADLAPGWFE